MQILILIIIYIAFIAVGIPDSLLGAAWPEMYHDLSVPVANLSYLTMIIYGCVVMSSIMSVKILQKIGTAKTTALSTALIAGGIFGFSISPNLLCMCMFATLIGFGSGAINTGLNNYIALHYHVRHINYLHCFYGVGLMCSTGLLTATLEKSGWRVGYRYIFIVQAAIAVLLFVTIPLWKKQTSVQNEVKEEPQEKLSVLQMVRQPAIRTFWCFVYTTNAIECAVGTWLSTYLVDGKKFSLEWGAMSLTLYFAGLALGRFISGLISKKIKTWNRISIGTIIVLAATVALNIPVPKFVVIAAMLLIGFGNGSIYPNLIHLTPHIFEEKHSGSIVASEIAVAYIGVMTAPAIFGVISKWTGIERFPVFLLVVLAIMILSYWRIVSMLRKQGKYDKTV